MRVLGELVKKVQGLGPIRDDLQGVEQPMPIEHPTEEGDVRRAIVDGQNRQGGVSHLLHTKRPSHLRAFLDKLGNIEGEVLDRLIDLNIVLPGGGRPDAVVVFLQPS